MGDISVHDGQLHIELTVAERVLTLHKRDVQIPLSSIISAQAVPDILAYKRGLKMGGAGIPGVAAIGTWRGTDPDGHAFADFALAHHRGPGVVIETADADYDRLLLGTDDTDTLLAELRR